MKLVVKSVIQSRAQYVLHTRHNDRVHDLSCAALGTSCGGSACCAPLWTSWRTATPGHCSSTCFWSACTPSPPAALTSSAPCRPRLVTSATSSTTARSASTVSVRCGTHGRFCPVCSEWHLTVDKHIIIITLTQWPFLSNISGQF